MSTPESNWRELCAELAGWIERSTRHYIQDPDVLIRAYAALDEPEPEVVGPTDEELWEMYQGSGTFSPVDFARAVLARWGHHPAPPAGELLKEAAWLRNECSAENADGNWISMSIDQALDLASLLERQAAPVLEPALARINDILNDSRRALLADVREALELARRALEQRHPAPVPVSERLPGPEDCDGEGRCYAWDWLASDWRMVPAEWVQTKPDYNWWLPATALPLPSGEADHG